MTILVLQSDLTAPDEEVLARFEVSGVNPASVACNSSLSHNAYGCGLDADDRQFHSVTAPDMTMVP